MGSDAKLIELVGTHHMLATRALVEDAGLSAGQWQRLVQEDVWVPVVPGRWRHAATPLTWEMKVHAGSAWLGDKAALHGATAARWWGLDGCHTESVEFLVPRSRRHLPPWLTLHTTLEWHRGDVLSHKGIRTSTATRAIIDMARTESPRTIETAIDSALIVEVSGRRGHTSDRDRQHDARRRNDLQASGWMVLEFTTADVLDDPSYVITTITEQLVTTSSRQRGKSGRGMT